MSLQSLRGGRATAGPGFARWKVRARALSKVFESSREPMVFWRVCCFGFLWWFGVVFVGFRSRGKFGFDGF